MQFRNEAQLFELLICQRYLQEDNCCTQHAREDPSPFLQNLCSSNARGEQRKRSKAVAVRTGPEVSGEVRHLLYLLF
jgi:hypothetical protein